MFDCLYAYIIEGGKEIGLRYVRNYHLIPYCRQAQNNEDEEGNLSNIAKTFTFAELKKQGITSHQLLEWHAPIDLVERYEMNINISNVFHKCFPPWFGSLCQYRFEDNTSIPFDEIVHRTISTTININSENASGTCYPFIHHCLSISWPLCLDWREICDGKLDCITGEDEQWCEQLQINECAEDEYRCHYGGQCIPLNFLKDNRLSIDCLDGSDEQDYFSPYNSFVNPHCFNVLTFRCQERIGRYLRSFQCGDGQYINEFFLPTHTMKCTNGRDFQYSRAILTSLEHISDYQCRDVFLCALYSNRTSQGNLPAPADIGNLLPYVNKTWDEDCEAVSKYCTDEWISIPKHPLLFGYFQLIYFTNRSVSDFQVNVTPDLICFDEQKCPILLKNLVNIKLINNLICTDALNWITEMDYLDFDKFLETLGTLSQRCTAIGIQKSCLNASYFHCIQSSKCIPWHYVRNGKFDCLYGEDEYANVCHRNNSKYFICKSEPTNCFKSVTVGDGILQCLGNEDELYVYTQNLGKLLSFSIICDRYENYPLDSLKSTDTDETNCTWWPCNNPNTRCDQIWHCPNGDDELNCSYSTCSANEHSCWNSQSASLYCLPITQIYGQYYYDENKLYFVHQIYFYNGTENLGANFVSWNNTKCYTNSYLDHNLYDVHTLSYRNQICFYLTIPFEWFSKPNVLLYDNNETLCYFDFGHAFSFQLRDRFFVVSHLGDFPPVTTNHSISAIPEEESKKISIERNKFPSPCHRGIPILTNTNHQTTITCLCPPNYFGDRCQWQNQRISLTLQFIWRSTASTNVIFQAMIMLIDDDGHIAPYFDQIIYIPFQDCDTKFNIYLLYPDRPKNLTKNYSIRIDLYDKRTLSHWTSWLLSIPFSFLPVNRIVTQLFIPEIYQTTSCSLSCGKYGKCTRYGNINSSYFCQCHSGYTGLLCNIKYSCNCAKDSLCVGSSMCICPLHKFGRHCYLNHPICQSTKNPCRNNGLCIPNDYRISFKNFTCFCTDDYSGDRCQNVNNRIDIQLDDIIMKETSLILLHFITAFKNSEHQRTTFLKKIPFSQSILTLYVSQEFHIVFIQIPNGDYYLAILREIYIPSEYILTYIKSDQHCLSIDQLNHTLTNQTFLFRTKFYPLICRKNRDLKCFYDEDLMCICDLDRFSNCFQFNHSTNYDCQGYNQCENNGQCFQNNETCPTRSNCMCPDCYYGTKCQFSTKGFLFSLDPILGYHIKQHVSLNQQPLIIKISIVINIIMLVLGLISSILSFITFCPKKSRQLGSGNYLLTASLTSLLMIIILTLKLWNLIFSQMSIITNRIWLIISCKSLDYILKVSLASTEWLTACVAIERMISVSKGINFNKIQSKKYSKWVIISVFLLTTLTLLQDPIYRQLIDDFDADEQRIWCFLQYSICIRYYNTFITLLHFLAPFSIHVVTAVRIIQNLAHRRSIIQPEYPYQAHFQQEFHRHRHILFAPAMLILLSLPRLVISFMKDCMRSAREPWFYLIGYFVSFVPSTLIFMVFVLPSKHYKKEFMLIYTRTIRRLRRIIRFINVNSC